MNNEQIIKLAREVGYSSYDALAERLHEFAKLAYAAGAAAEREECALIAWIHESAEGGPIEAAIRARKVKIIK